MRPTGSPVRLRVDRPRSEALEERPIAAALSCLGVVAVRRARYGAPHHRSTGIGVCSSSLVDVDGRPSHTPA